MKPLAEPTPADLVKKTREIEAERELRQAEREERQRLKKLKARQQFQEKLVAPFLLILTILISVSLFLWFN